MMPQYDAVLLVSFGGPEKREDVIPFLENVLRGRNVPRERMLEVAEHYYHFDGVSPINEQCRDLIAALQPMVDLPIYWGNRNWNPFLKDTVEAMRRDGVRWGLAVATSAFGSYSGCRQYLEDLDAARSSVTEAPRLDKLPPFWSHDSFIEAMADRLREGLAKLPGAEVVYTAHSIPVSMAQSSPYERQLQEAAARVHRALKLEGEPRFVFQSRSGPPGQPWLEPDVCDYLRGTTAKKVVALPIGFLSDHMEVVYDLDTEATEVARERGIEFVRAGTAGTHPRFVEGLAELIREAQANGVAACAGDCCPPPVRPGAQTGRPR